VNEQLKTVFTFSAILLKRKGFLLTNLLSEQLISLAGLIIMSSQLWQQKEINGRRGK